ncbi:MAG: universal stress protein [Chitinophagaceae bacterium]|nr:universal stress protein [Chitinophagaceae bacterium]
MQHILVPTDLSRDARPGMRFAIQWSTQQKVKLVFAHVLYVPRLTRWNDTQYNKFAASERVRYKHKLEKAVTDIYARMAVKGGHYECRVIEGAITEPTLLDYCRHHPEIDLVCMGTHGAAGIKKLFGTRAGNMVSGSGIPVVVVPKSYRVRPVTSVLYATDLLHYEEELKQVTDLAAKFKSSLDILHLLVADTQVPHRNIFQKVLAKEFHYPIRVHLPERDETRSIAANLRRQIQALKPSLAVLFTDQGHTIFEKIFLSSTAEKVAFSTPVPLMVYPKKKEP